MTRAIRTSREPATRTGTPPIGNSAVNPQPAKHTSRPATRITTAQPDPRVSRPLLRWPQCGHHAPARSSFFLSGAPQPAQDSARRDTSAPQSGHFSKRGGSGCASFLRGPGDCDLDERSRLACQMMRATIAATTSQTGISTDTFGCSVDSYMAVRGFAHCSSMRSCATRSPAGATEGLPAPDAAGDRDRLREALA